MFYTYTHTRLDNGEVFYIGKGCRERYLSKHSRNPYWNNVASKAGWKADILCYWETEEDAYAHEKFLIQCFTDIGAKLTNISLGGELYEGKPPVAKKAVKCTSHNLIFDSCTRAAEWMNSRGFPKVNRSRISNLCYYSKAHEGYTFEYTEPFEIRENPWQFKEVYCVPLFGTNTGEPHISESSEHKRYVVTFSSASGLKTYRNFTWLKAGSRENAFELALKFKYSLYDQLYIGVPNKDDHFPQKEKYLKCLN